MMQLKVSGFANKKANIYYWLKSIGVVATGQVLVQGLAIITGIIVIRLLPTKEYAWYVIANTMLGTLTMLSDSGISSGVMSEGSKVWQDKDKLGVVMATGLYLRRRFAIISLIVSIPILTYMLWNNNAGPLTIFLIIVSLIPSFFAALSDSILEINPKLHQELNLLQKNQISVGIIRLILSTLTLFVFPMTFVAIFANGLPRTYGNIKLRKISNKFISLNQVPDKHIQKQILKIVAKALPGCIYGLLVGQITIYMLSILGNTNSIGQIGALGKISLIFTVWSSVFNMIIVPRWARLEKNAKNLLSKYFQIFLINLAVCLVVLVLVILFPKLFLFILGKQYAGLSKELVLTIIVSCAALLVGSNGSLSTSRGWILNPVLGISTGVGSIVLGLSIFKFNTLTGALYYNLFLEVVAIIIGTTFCFIKIAQTSNQTIN